MSSLQRMKDKNMPSGNNASIYKSNLKPNITHFYRKIYTKGTERFQIKIMIQIKVLTKLET